MPQRTRPARFVSNRYRAHFIILFLIILIFLVVTAFVQFWPNTLTGKTRERRDLNSLQKLQRNAQPVIIKSSAPQAKDRDTDCIYHSCFDVYGCGDNEEDHRIKVYISPLTKYVDENGISITLPLSQEYFEILETIVESDYFTSSQNDACLIVPPIDLLNQNKLRVEETSQVLASLPSWNGGANHLLFNMLPGSVPDFSTVLDVKHDKAIIAGGGFSSFTYRRTYDVSIPIYNPLVSDKKIPRKSYLESRKILVISAQAGIIPEYRDKLQKMSRQYPDDFKVLDKCKLFDDGTYNHTVRCDGETEYSYPEILQEATFCTVIRGARLGQTALSDALMSGCIPVVFSDTFVMPFSEILDWKRAALVLREEQLSTLMSILKNISSERIRNMRRQVQFLWESYFSSLKMITLTTLQIINDRVFPYAARKYEEWNELPENRGLTSPLFFPMIPSKTPGFTAVILTYDRIDSLFQVIRQVAQTPSLAKVLVIWNNQKKSPPPSSGWPKIGAPLKVIQTRQNLLSNRFYPHEEIQTEAILALDDDIVMLTPDEVEFGFEVWREFPDRLIGFPSRLHQWDNATGKWRYESEWTNEISMVLTGAAFYHKYYSFLYTHKMPGNIKKWVDDNVNCEDIAMNFLIANMTGKAPIKVAPRKKFKCPECINQEMLSADAAHMVERSECINKFVEVYKTMPLKTAEFRADPVLYKDNMPSQLMRFPDVGSL